MIEIYSRDGCQYCKMAAELLKQKNIDFLEHKLDVNFTREYLLEKFPTAKTFPVIVVDGYNIGGYSQLTEHLRGSESNQQLLNERISL